MKQQPVPILALLVATLLFATVASADNSVVVAAQETRVSVAPRDAQLRLVKLPAIEFGLRAAFRCVGSPTSLTFSITDTLETMNAEQLYGRRAVETTLIVPPRQLTLAASRQFCISDDNNTVNELLVPGFVTAHASLRCEKDGESTMHFASAPLQLRLSCERPGADADQDASGDSSPGNM